MPYYENKRKNGEFYSECDHCGKGFWRKTKQLCKMHQRETNFVFCSKECSYEFKNKEHNVVCFNCNKEFTKKNCQLRSDNHFCSRSCAATYNNRHKTKGTRVSKLEKWLQEKLTSNYPHIEFNFNNTNAINYELDIYIPSLKLAFELNGIFHYEPIFGKTKLEKIQENDNNKFKLCIENEIDLCIIDTTSQKRFSENSSEIFLEIIYNIMDDRISSFF